MKRNRSSLPKPIPNAAQLALEDQAFCACRKIAILGRLLAATHGALQEELSWEVVSHSGQMIAEEADHLERLLEARRSGD